MKIEQKEKRYGESSRSVGMQMGDHNLSFSLVKLSCLGAFINLTESLN